MGVPFLLADLFNWTLAATPAAVLATLILMTARSLLRYQISARIFYFLWLVMLIRFLSPWVPSVDFISLSFPVGAFQEGGIGLYDGRIVDAAQDAPYNQSVMASQPATNYQSKAILWKDVLLHVWLAGVGILMLIFGYIYFKWRRMLASEKPVEVPPILLEWLTACKKQLNIGMRVELQMTAHISTPATYGWWRPKILIPARMIGQLDKEDWTCILLHELIHIRRRDAFWNGLMTLLLLLHWFNPFMWLAWLRMREDQELSCDALATGMVDKKSYGSAMIKVLELMPSSRQNALIPFISGKTKLIKRRVTMIAMKKKPAFTIKAAIIVAVFSIAIFSGVTIHAKQQPASDSNSQDAEPPYALASDSYILPAEGRIALHFGDTKKISKNETQTSNGIEIINEEGTPVYAAADGVIGIAGYGSAEGNQIVISHAADVQSVYSHLSDIVVQAGEEVKQGQQIGTIGSTGQSTGTHLKFQMLVNNVYTDPETLVQ
ncbi:M56 family metallopeptidase [Paenibacillus paeoniae]|uniref:Uncharacterized protein n=1 Tax=Paenibacillus paeoniae TaxID=2292705 RepID=A0A371PEH9_9BACL|nr:M23/M56 family metallopeptidase [Paenibacillus paeoniae]REK74317.1 hypothetical protein DX130_17455 [Paenibacillus paeoniae]